MRKALLLAMTIVMAAAVSAATPQKVKKAKKATPKTENPAPAPVKLDTKGDTLSYAAGMFTTRGLMDYARQQFGIDSTNMQSFIEGIKEGIEKQGDRQFAARNAGRQIAEMVGTRMFPNISRDLSETEWPMDSVKFYAGFLDAVKADTTVMNAERGIEYFTNVMMAEKLKKEEAYKVQNEQWLAKNATAEGVTVLPSGLQYKVLTQGNGIVAGMEDNVTVRYEGHTIDGNVFDSSYKRTPDTSTFRPDQVIKGWTEALTMMPEGSKWMLYIPQELAYGARTAGSIKPYSALVFTVELVKVDKKQEIPAEEEVVDKKKDKKKKKK